MDSNLECIQSDAVSYAWGGLAHAWTASLGYHTLLASLVSLMREDYIQLDVETL